VAALDYYAKRSIVTRRPFVSVAVFLGLASVVLVPWVGWLAVSLPCRYVSQHWSIAWTGFDTALAGGLAATCVGALRHAAWLDRAAVATATLLGADAWFDIVTSRGGAAVALATLEAIAIELPVAFLCLWLLLAVKREPSREWPRLES
jgi:hypothetical protein